MIKILLIYSFFLFVFAFVITALSLTGTDIETYLPYVQLMNIGAIVSFSLTFFILRNDSFPALPIWAKLVLLYFFLFSLYYFFISFFNMTPIQSGGKYFLVNHGNPTEEISKNEFIKIKTENFVSTSSRWIAFCGWATAILFFYEKSKNKRELEVKQ